MRFQLLAAQLALATFLLALAAALLAVGGVRLGLMPFGSGFSIMTAATALGLLALAVALAWLVCALKSNHGAGKRAGLIALLGSLALLYPPLHTVYLGMTSPAIHDATTNPEDAPQFVALAKLRQPGMNSPAYDGNVQITFQGETNTAAYMLHTYYAPLTKPYARLLTSKAKLFGHALETARKMGWQIVDASETDGRIEATDRSFWFGQTADIVIRVQTAGNIGARLDIRSQSERGARDFGSNLARLTAYLKAL
jgi:hypothetical protein